MKGERERGKTKELVGVSAVAMAVNVRSNESTGGGHDSCEEWLTAGIQRRWSSFTLTLTSTFQVCVIVQYR